MARRIVAHFGLETLDIIEGKADRLIETPGIGKKRVKMIQKAWAEQKTIKEVMIFFAGSWRFYHLRCQNLQAVRG